MTESSRTRQPYISPVTPTVIGSADTAANDPDGESFDALFSYSSAV